MIFCSNSMHESLMLLSPAVFCQQVGGSNFGARLSRDGSEPSSPGTCKPANAASALSQVSCLQIAGISLRLSCRAPGPLPEQKQTFNEEPSTEQACPEPCHTSPDPVPLRHHTLTWSAARLWGLCVMLLVAGLHIWACHRRLGHTELAASIEAASIQASCRRTEAQLEDMQRSSRVSASQNARYASP
jgi:hypothetical protein